MGFDSNLYVLLNFKIVIDSFKIFKIGFVIFFKSDMEKLKKSIEFGERVLILLFDDSFLDEFCYIFLEYLVEKNKCFMFEFIDYMNY